MITKCYARQENILICNYKEGILSMKPITHISIFYNEVNTLNGKPRIIRAYNTFTVVLINRTKWLEYITEEIESAGRYGRKLYCVVFREFY